MVELFGLTVILKLLSHHTGSYESFLISHISLRFVYPLGQRYNVERIHMLALDMYTNLSALLKNVSSQR